MSRRADNDINLVELIGAIWTHKTSVVVTQFVCVTAALLYVVLLAPTMYEARSRFELLEAGQSNQALGGLASLVGLAAQNGDREANRLEDRILSRPYVENVFAEAGFESDEYFNGVYADNRDAYSIRSLIRGAQSKSRNHDELVSEVLNTLSDSLTISLKKNGVIELVLLHPDPDRAAEVVNTLVSHSILDIHERGRELSLERLEYFRDQLSGVQEKLDAANLALSEFALTENLNSEQDLARASNQLSQLRDNVRRQNAYLSVVQTLERAVTSEFDAPAFIERFPSVTELEFRRYFGWDVDEGTWELPDRAYLDEVKIRILANKREVERQISNILSVAAERGRAARRLEELTRDAKVQEAVYDAMIRQFEAEALSSGFETSSARVIDPAVVPSVPVAPKKLVVLVISFVFGGFLGIGIAIFRALRSDILFSASAILDSSAAENAVLVIPEKKSWWLQIPSFGGSSTQDLQCFSLEELRTMLVGNPKSMFFLSAHHSREDIGFVHSLAKKCSVFLEKKVCILDTTGSVFPEGLDGSSNISWRNCSNLEAADIESGLREQLEELYESNEFVILFNPNIQDLRISSIELAANLDLTCVLVKAGKLKKSELRQVDDFLNGLESSQCTLLVK
ncbi:GumC family protein [Shimia sp. MMG029]|uniref:GumC family protein n=1 Tax=Shimia sp. MMG029 TaxID=3021978 RepID=UPI0022FEE97A|nr:GNVR domain-containing protein [Shimia sp. MMG029]MDA5559058.1 GNVR domain-containing protein [Shimia sp. MMG029]